MALDRDPAAEPREKQKQIPSPNPQTPESLPKALNPKLKVLNPTLTHQNLLFCRVPINSILGFIIRNKKVGFGSLR